MAKPTNTTKIKNHEGRVNPALGAAKYRELTVVAKRLQTSRGALAKAFVLDGLDRIALGMIEIKAGVSIIRPITIDIKSGVSSASKKF